MATWDDVARIAAGLPETGEGTTWDMKAWQVRGKSFVWERPLRNSDRRDLGDDVPPDGPILAAYVEDLDDKDLLITEDPEVFFTIPHFTGFRAVLILLDRIAVDRLDEVMTEAWLVRAPKRLAKEFLAQRAEA